MTRSFALIVGVVVASTPAFSQPTCDDDAVLEAAMARYFGLSEYKGMTDTQIRERLVGTPEMQHWKLIAKENEVGEAIANWVINIDLKAIISTQHLVTRVTTTSSSYDPNSKMYTCQATLEFDNEEMISYLTLVTLNSWLYSANGIQMLDAGASMNDMAKWRAVEGSLSSQLQQIAKRIASCVRKRVSFTVQPSQSGFTIGEESMAPYDRDCLMRSSD